MRIGKVLLIATGLALAGCSANPTNETANVQEDAQAVATPTLVLTAGAGGTCTATWDGEAVTPETLRDRSFAVLERAVATAGGPGRIQEQQIPIPRVVAAPALPWPCVAPWIDVVAQSGFLGVHLAAVPDEISPPFLSFPVPGLPPPPIPAPVVTVGAEGRFVWDGAAVDAAGLRQRLGGGDPLDAPPPSATVPVEAPPPVLAAPAGVSFVPGNDATVGSVREALLILRDARVEANLDPGPEAAAGAAPPPPPAR